MTFTIFRFWCDKCKSMKRAKEIYSLIGIDDCLCVKLICNHSITIKNIKIEWLED